MPKAAIIGGGVIGGGWAARFLLMGWDVVVADPDPEVMQGLLAAVAERDRLASDLRDNADALGFGELGLDRVESLAGLGCQEGVRIEVSHCCFPL